MTPVEQYVPPAGDGMVTQSAKDSKALKGESTPTRTYLHGN